MPLSDAASRAGGMLNDLKSRLGFARDEDRYDNYDDYDDYDDDYDDYDDRNDRNDRNDRDSGYVPVKPVRDLRASSTRSSRNAHADLSQNLVSIDDVKARTQVPESLTRDPLERDDTPRMTYRNGRNFVENGGPAESSPAYNAARARERESASRSEGLNSLFEPSSTSASSSYDPYVAYSSSSPSTYSGARGLTVIKPVSYGDVESVARAVKAGDVVVLAMRTTPDELSKRILDFSFGVASALDANVECPANKVFAIARGRALSEEEKRNLRNQGVL